MPSTQTVSSDNGEQFYPHRNYYATSSGESVHVLYSSSNEEPTTSAAAVKDTIECQLYINGIPVSVIVDTASDITILNVETYDKYFLHDALVHSNLAVFSYTKSKTCNVECP